MPFCVYKTISSNSVNIGTVCLGVFSSMVMVSYYLGYSKIFAQISMGMNFEAVYIPRYCFDTFTSFDIDINSLVRLLFAARVLRDTF